MSSLTVEEEQKWVPTHVQVTVLRGRGLRGKGKHGTSDVYTIIQLGKEKYSTCVVEKTTEPEWREECSFELQPGVLEGGGRSDHPAGSRELILTVMHRALIGPDVFLGQAVIHLEKLFAESRCVKNEWYRLNSKTGKKEKERGDIQVTVQFTRNNMTASMYDLVMKDKSTFTFSKLKERMKGKRRSSDEDSSSAVLPGGYGSLYRMRHRLPSDGGGEEDYEDDEGGEARRSKMRTFFLRGKLRKSSDTRSSTSLGSESSESSSRGGSLSPTAGISVVVSDLSNSPSNSSNLTADNSPEHTANTSPKSSSLKCEFGDEAGEITIAVPQPTLCVNGSHAYKIQSLDPGSGKPADTLGLGLLQKSLPLSMSLQNLSPRASADLPKGPVGDGRRWSFDKPGEEEKAAIAAALEKSGPMQADDADRAEEEEEVEDVERRLGRASSSSPPSRVASSSESESHGKKQRRNLFSHGRSESAGKGQSQSKDGSVQAGAEEKHKGWFGSKESHSKPSSVVSPTLGPSSDPHPLSSELPASPLHHTNPFFDSQTTPPPVSPRNPFFSLLNRNPFYEDMLTPPPSKPSPPPLPYLSSARPPISQLFPQSNHHNPVLTRVDSIADASKRPLPPVPLSKKLPNPFTSAGEPESEWDESFEAFAAGRLQSPEEAAALPRHHQPCRKVAFEAHKAADHVTNANSHHPDAFSPQLLETIPEHRGSDGDNVAFSTNLTNSKTSTNDFTTSTQLSNNNNSGSSPDPGSSGLGSSADEDFLSCLSSYSDKFSASSSLEETETQHFESIIPVLSFEKPSESAEAKSSKRCESDRSNDKEQTLNIPKIAQPKQIYDETREKSATVEISDVSVSNKTDVKAPDEEFSSTDPSLFITTSSPGVGGGQDVAPHPQVMFEALGDFLNVSVLQNSLDVSSESQDYQTCESLPSEPDETLHSATSTLRRIQTSLREDSSGDSDLRVPPAALTDSNTSFSEGADGVVSGNEFTKRPQAQSAPLYRSQSEGTLTPDFEELLIPSFGSDPGAISRDSSLSGPAPDLLCFTSFAPSLTPEGGSFPAVALCSSPLLLANASATSEDTRTPHSPQQPQPQPQPQSQSQAADQQNSPHPVKPLTTATVADEKRSEGRSVLATGLEKLKSTIHPGRSSQLSEQETDRRKSLTEGAGSYYHLNHSELVALLVQREAELERQKAEFERQRVLLAKREVELKRLKPQVRDLEDYIDTLLVRIMEQKPTLLQVRSKFK